MRPHILAVTLVAMVSGALADTPTWAECKAFTSSLAAPGGKLEHAVSELEAASQATSDCDHLKAAYAETGSIADMLMNCSNPTAYSEMENAIAAAARGHQPLIDSLHHRIGDAAVARGCLKR